MYRGVLCVLCVCVWVSGGVVFVDKTAQDGVGHLPTYRQVGLG